MTCCLRTKQMDVLFDKMNASHWLLGVATVDIELLVELE